MHELKLPNLGEGIEHGEVARVLVAKGDSVAEQQTVIELETDKALVEVPSDAAGTVADVLIKQGDTIKVGQVILTLEAAALEQRQTQASMPAGEPAGPGRAAPAEPALVQTSAPQAAPAMQQAVESAVPTPVQAPARVELASQDVTPAVGPATRRYARELGVDLNAVKGSGRGGRVRQDDVREYVRTMMQGRGTAATPQAAPELPDFSQWGTIETEPLSMVRRTTSAHVAQSWQAVALVTQFDDADITELEAMRQHFKPEAQQHGVHLTLTVLLLKALVAALKVYPHFNSSLDLGRGQLIIKRYYHIGIATDTPRGLLVPVLRDVDSKDIWQLSAELEQLVERARSGHAELSELRGASFSLSNQGGIGGTHFTPLVNLPEVAILGVGQARTTPVWDATASQFHPRLLLPLALSYDHRANDGADAARFIAHLRRSLEDPERLLLGL